ncbi:thioredoxin domain-containing protein [Chitinophaga varians]|uniref:thioredoxin domain-containing protein n=1 Tax=Chitinophaga varians TaxID=2202339 RepID=UPI00165F1203|nr:thioredoxin domain-containing protein [Chitinophaga varians]MBC9915096.1 thioredoxin family protein [Chitinophaga varians]
MKKYILLIILTSLSKFLEAQNSGTNFIEGLTYQEMKSKAKLENKKIFIELYATWCTNCKMMDPVFSKESVSEILNGNYISTKLQLDTGKNDNESIKRMYPFAEEIKKKYKISGVPTFLFLDVDGNLLGIEKGVQNINKIIEISKAAIDPNENFTHLYAQYTKGQLKGPSLLKLAHYLNLLNEKTASEQVAQKYRSITWDNKEIKSVLNPDFLETIREFPSLYTTQDSLISYIYRNKEESDSLFHERGASEYLINYLIRRDLIEPEIKKSASENRTPNWTALENKLSRNWGMNAKASIIFRKIDYYIEKKDWKRVTQGFIERTELLGISRDINAVVWYYFFERSNDHYALNKAISYMEKDLEKNPSNYVHIDTYANVLYKAGHVEKALQFEEKALNMAEAKNDQKNSNTYKECLEKMKKGIPTWTDNQLQ